MELALSWFSLNLIKALTMLWPDNNGIIFHFNGEQVGTLDISGCIRNFKNDEFTGEKRGSFFPGDLDATLSSARGDS